VQGRIRPHWFIPDFHDDSLIAAKHKKLFCRNVFSKAGGKRRRSGGEKDGFLFRFMDASVVDKNVHSLSRRLSTSLPPYAPVFAGSGMKKETWSWRSHHA
jgi:hypothetical protein